MFLKSNQPALPAKRSVIFLSQQRLTSISRLADKQNRPEHYVPGPERFA
jgi:hypothetical protein